MNSTSSEQPEASVEDIKDVDPDNGADTNVKQKNFVLQPPRRSIRIRGKTNTLKADETSRQPETSAVHSKRVDVVNGAGQSGKRGEIARLSQRPDFLALGAIFDSVEKALEKPVKSNHDGALVQYPGPMRMAEIE